MYSGCDDHSSSLFMYSRIFQCLPALQSCRHREPRSPQRPVHLLNVRGASIDCKTWNATSFSIYRAACIACFVTGQGTVATRYRATSTSIIVVPRYLSERDI